MNTPKKRIDFNLFRKEKVISMSGGIPLSSAYAMASESRELKDLIVLAADKYDVVWVSAGEWSMHQMLLSLLNVTGASTVMISSYAMGETPARVLAGLKEDKIISTLHCVLDDRVDVRNAKSLQLIKNICDGFKLVSCHAKVTLIKNDNWCISVIGSANYTENKRYEAGIISHCPNVYELNRRWMEKELSSY